jgi:hypothetical protein
MVFGISTPGSSVLSHDKMNNTNGKSKMRFDIIIDVFNNLITLQISQVYPKKMGVKADCIRK